MCLISVLNFISKVKSYGTDIVEIIEYLTTVTNALNQQTNNKNDLSFSTKKLIISNDEFLTMDQPIDYQITPKNIILNVCIDLANSISHLTDRTKVQPKTEIKDLLEFYQNNDIDIYCILFNDELIMRYLQLVLHRFDEISKRLKRKKNLFVINSNLFKKENTDLLGPIQLPGNIDNIDYLFIPVGFDLHWNAIVVELKNENIFIFDSYKSNPFWHDRLKFSLNRVLWLLTKKLNLNQNWNISIKNLEQQSNCFDCGVYTCMVFDYLSDGFDPIFIQNNNMQIHRQNIGISRKNKKIVYGDFIPSALPGKILQNPFIIDVSSTKLVTNGPGIVKIWTSEARI
jgi:hypothetical protein